MGLDSIELVVSFEKYFNVRIPDKKAEELRTVQETVDRMAELLVIADNRPLLKDDIFNRLQKHFLNINITAGSIDQADLISHYISENNISKWQVIFNDLGQTEELSKALLRPIGK
jgi:hypothetical protein